MVLDSQKWKNQIVDLQFGEEITLYLKLDDRMDSSSLGNKYYKLKYNFQAAKKLDKRVVLTFGGAFSNHIAAVAFAGKKFGFETIGVIRGEELESKIEQNSTLKLARECGMQLKFVTRGEYRDKDSEEFLKKLKNEYEDFYLIPEGGTNALAVKGCEEILTKEDEFFDYICCSVGTGGTVSGLINCSQVGQQVLGFPALKGEFLKDEIRKFTVKTNWKLITDYHFGGYAKINNELISFINQFKKDYNIPLDPIYTGKMMFGIYDLIKKGYLKKNSKVLAIHTGGLQGIAGMNEVLKKKKMNLIHV